MAANKSQQGNVLWIFSGKARGLRVVHGRGWGTSVFYLFVFWLFVAVGILLATGGYQPDHHKTAMAFQWMLASVLAVTAICVAVLSRYRKTHPKIVGEFPAARPVKIPHVDDFMFIRFDLWPYILLAVAGAMAVMTLLGVELFKDRHPHARTILGGSFYVRTDIG